MVTSRIEVVLFDLDGTLCSYERSIASVLERAFAEVGVEPLFPPDAYLQRYDEYLNSCETAAELTECCFMDLAEEYGYEPQLGSEVAMAYTTIREYGTVRIHAGARAVLAAFSEEYTLGLVTNGHRAKQAKKLEMLDIAAAFETIVYAGHDVLAKPDPEPFYSALDAVQAPPDRAVYVGNSLSADVAGARAAGLASVWVSGDSTRGPDDPIPDYVIETVSDLEYPPWEGT